MDIVSVNNADKLTIHYFDSTGQVSLTSILFGPTSMVEVIAEDLIGNTLPDLAVATSAEFLGGLPSPVIWEQTSPRVFEIAASLPTYGVPGIAAADINSDGALDIITVSNQDRSVMIHWGDPKSCPADFTMDGTLDFFDISGFIQAFGANAPAADFTNDGVWDFFDISSFIQAFAQGCP